MNISERQLRLVTVQEHLVEVAMQDVGGGQAANDDLPLFAGLVCQFTNDLSEPIVIRMLPTAIRSYRFSQLRHGSPCLLAGLTKVPFRKVGRPLGPVLPRLRQVLSYGSIPPFGRLSPCSGWHVTFRVNVCLRQVCG